MGRSSCLNSSRSDEMKFASFRKQPLPASWDGHLEKTSEKTGWKRFFSPAFTFSDYLQVQRERERENLLFFLRKYFHDDTPDYSWCPGENYVKLWLLDPKWTCSPPSYLRDVPVLFTARMWTVRVFWGIRLPILSLICAKSRGRCSAVWCIWERGNALCPLPKKEVKRGGKTHLPSRCV